MSSLQLWDKQGGSWCFVYDPELFNSLPNHQMLDKFKWKATADNILNVAE